MRLNKLTAQQVVRIREVYAEDYYTQKDIAGVFSVSVSSIGLIVRGKTRKDVGGPISPRNVNRCGKHPNSRR